MSLYIDISVGDTLRVGAVIIRLQAKSGKKARLSIDAPKDLRLGLEKQK